MMKNKWKQCIFFLGLFLLITGFLLVCSLATSPVYPHNFSYDSAFFRFVGKEILKGKTPYADIWDHKGPFLFFIQALGAVGGTTNKGYNVLFLLQSASAFLSVFFMYKTHEIINRKENYLKFAVILAAVAAVFSITIESGNLTEEWCLPFTCCSFFMMARYAAGTPLKLSHPVLYAFIHGICIGLMAFIRVNNAISVCAGLLVIGIYLLVKKQWKNLLENLFFGATGIICAALPIMGWYYARGALKEMLYATFLFNLDYMQIRSFIRFTGAAFITRYLPIIAAAIVLLLFWLREKSFRLLDMIAASILSVTALLLFRSNVYLHYYTIFIPVLFFVLLRCEKNFHAPELVIMILLFAWFGWINIDRIPDLISLHRQPQMFTAAAKIPENEKKSMIAVSMPSELYLNYDLEPVSRFVTYQHVYFLINPDFKTEFMTTLTKKNPPKWILAFCSGETNIPEVQELIDREYIYRFDESDICYYQKK